MNTEDQAPGAVQTSMSTKRWIILIVLVATAGAYALLRPRGPQLAEAYVGERAATVFNTTAQVREALATLRYGDKVVLLDRRGAQAKVRTAAGVTGWMDARVLIEPALWHKGIELLAQTHSAPVQASGRTKVPTNLRAEPGRSGPRLYQFNRDVAVEIFARQIADVPSDEAGAKESSNKAEANKPRREDWVLVRGRATPAPGLAANAMAVSEEPSMEIAGWALARFIELGMPEPVRDYASSSGMRVVAWFELNRVPDAGGEKPQYLAVGVRGAEGQSCDFTLLRVYTWGAKRHRYETAFVDSELCGWLPIRVSKAANGDPEFRFSALGKGGREERLYHMRQTVVRRVREPEHPAAPKKK